MTVEHDTQSSIRELQPFSNRFQKLTQQNDIGCMFQWYTEWGPRPNGQFFCAAKCVLCGGKFKIMIKNRGLKNGLMAVKIFSDVGTFCSIDRLPPKLMWTPDIVELLIECTTLDFYISKAFRAQGIDGALLEVLKLEDVHSFVNRRQFKLIKDRFACFL